MDNTDLFNLTLLESNEKVDQINKKFYGRYNYPWPPFMFPAYPERVAALLVNQDIGHWRHERLPRKPVIWVAGCGTNQALFTALRFPEAEVYATDISTQSLNTCKENARQAGVKNLFLEEKSLNDIDYEDQFDYIICTGVVHHNARPSATLANIARALKKNGIFEFMVYNYYHRLLTTACQKAIRNFYDSSSTLDLGLELKLIRHLIDDYQYSNVMGGFLQSHAEMHEAEMTDALVQPVEYSYTVESLAKMLESCNLEYLMPCQNQFDVKNKVFSWNMNFKDEYLRGQYESLPDIKRWQITNLLMFNDSPMLWFYLQRRDSDIGRKTEQQVCEEFLDTKFRKSAFSLTNYVLGADGKYTLRGIPVKHPSPEAVEDQAARNILNLVSPDKTMREIFGQAGVGLDFYEVNKVRIKLTTSAYPYLFAVAT